MKNERSGRFLMWLVWLSLSAWCTTSLGLEVNLSDSMPFVEVVHEGKVVRIQRIQDQNHELTGGYARTSRKCPPFCIQPMHVAPGVTTIGELELFDFMQEQLKDGTGLLIDARTPDWHAKGTIPGSVNIPFTYFSLAEDDPRLQAALAQLGVTRKSGSGVVESTWGDIKQAFGLGRRASATWDFSHAKDLALWCNGIWCGQSPRAIHGLLKLGYPAEKIRYYRGGMQVWMALGLTTVVPSAGGAH